TTVFRSLPRSPGLSVAGADSVSRGTGLGGPAGVGRAGRRGIPLENRGARGRCVPSSPRKDGQGRALRSLPSAQVDADTPAPPFPGDRRKSGKPAEDDQPLG